MLFAAGGRIGQCRIADRQAADSHGQRGTETVRQPALFVAGLQYWDAPDSRAETGIQIGSTGVEVSECGS
jgi:hypothetical protein